MREFGAAGPTVYVAVSKVVRAQPVLLAAEGLDNDDIATRLNTRREVVSKWRKHSFVEGLAGLVERPRWGRPVRFSLSLAVEIKAIAYEPPALLRLPLALFRVPDIRAEVLRRGLVAETSDATIRRWLSDDAIAPWRHCSWIFPRDPDFEVRPGGVRAQRAPQESRHHVLDGALEDELGAQTPELAQLVGTADPIEQDLLDRFLDPGARGYPSFHGVVSFCELPGPLGSLRRPHFYSGFRTRPDRGHRPIVGRDDDSEP